MIIPCFKNNSIEEIEGKGQSKRQNHAPYYEIGRSHLKSVIQRIDACAPRKGEQTCRRNSSERMWWPLASRMRGKLRKVQCVGEEFTHDSKFDLF